MEIKPKRYQSYTGVERPKILSPDQARINVRKYNCNRKERDPKAHYFSKKAIEAILKQKGVVGLRVYYALNEKLDMEGFLVGVDAHGNNVFKGEFTEKGSKDMPAGGDSGIYASFSPCPQHCPPKETDFA